MNYVISVLEWGAILVAGLWVFFGTPVWIDEAVNWARGALCPLPHHSAKLRFKGLRLHYECSHCKHQWAEDRHREKAVMKVVK